jgi:hypothetical protein
VSVKVNEDESIGSLLADEQAQTLFPSLTPRKEAGEFPRKYPQRAPKIHGHFPQRSSTNLASSYRLKKIEEAQPEK